MSSRGQSQNLACFKDVLLLSLGARARLVSQFALKQRERCSQGAFKQTRSRGRESRWAKRGFDGRRRRRMDHDVWRVGGRISSGESRGTLIFVGPPPQVSCCLASGRWRREAARAPLGTTTSISCRFPSQVPLSTRTGQSLPCECRQQSRHTSFISPEPAAMAAPYQMT